MYRRHPYILICGIFRLEPGDTVTCFWFVNILLYYYQDFLRSKLSNVSISKLDVNP
jgi:hypothetical protein